MARYNVNSGYGQALLANIPLGAGKVFFVAPAATDIYSMLSGAIIPDVDGQIRLFTDIQEALDATVANRNDYVIVMPATADYDITAALTMSKARTHLICPAGIGWKGMPGNMARIHQNTAATDIITVSADTVEIAGFFFKQVLNSNAITLSSTRWCPHIHDNFFAMATSDAGTSAYGIYGAGAVSHFSIHDNYFTNYSPTLMTGTDNAVAAFVGFTSTSCTRGVIRDNIMHTGANTIVGAAILLTGYGMTVCDNYIFEDTAFGGSQAGVFTKGLNISVDTFATNNRLAVATAADAITGGTADHSANENWESENGGTIIEVI